MFMVGCEPLLKAGVKLLICCFGKPGFRKKTPGFITKPQKKNILAGGG